MKENKERLEQIAAEIRKWANTLVDSPHLIKLCDQLDQEIAKVGVIDEETLRGEVVAHLEDPYSPDDRDDF